MSVFALVSCGSISISIVQGGKGLGKGGAKRHRKVLRDNIQGVQQHQAMSQQQRAFALTVLLHAVSGGFFMRGMFRNAWVLDVWQQRVCAGPMHACSVHACLCARQDLYFLLFPVAKLTLLFPSGL